MFDGRTSLQKVIHRKPPKKKKKNRCLGLFLWQVLLRISLLRLRVPSLTLKHSILDLGNHVPDGECILEGIGLHRWLSLLTHSTPFGNFSIKRRGLGGKEFFGRRDCIQNFTNILREEDVFRPPQFRVCRDSRPVKCYCP